MIHDKFNITQKKVRSTRLDLKLALKIIDLEVKLPTETWVGLTS